MLLARDWYSFAEILTRTIMTEEASVVAICPDHDAAEQAVAKLGDASFDVTKVSIIGKDHTEESVGGYDTTRERMKYWGTCGLILGVAVQRLEHTPAAEVRIGFVDHNSAEPCDKAGATFELVRACKNAGMRFLHDVLNSLVAV